MAGNNEYSDIACSANGETFTVTWQSSANESNAERGLGYRASAQFSRLVTALAKSDSSQFDRHAGDDSRPDDRSPPVMVKRSTRLMSRMGILPDCFPMASTVLNLTVGLNITDNYDSFLTCWVESPQGTFVQLFSQVPFNANRCPIRPKRITSRTLPARASTTLPRSKLKVLRPTRRFTGTYVPAQQLATFQGQEAFGNWSIWIECIQAIPIRLPRRPSTASQPLFPPFRTIYIIGRCRLRPARSLLFPSLVTTQPMGNQEYPSIAMANDNSYTISWSGYGINQITGAAVTNGVFYQRFSSAGTPQAFTDVPVPTPGGSPTAPTSSPVINPGQMGVYTQTIPATVLAGTIYGIELTIVDVASSFGNQLTPVNLTATLTSPSGNVITLFSPPNLVPGVSFNPTTTGYFSNTIFDNAAKFNITNTVGDITPGVADSLPFSNSYRPQSGAFDTESSGVWTLRVTNGNSTDLIGVTTWSLLQSAALVSTESTAASAGLASIADDDNGNLALVWTDSTTSARIRMRIIRFSNTLKTLRIGFL